MVIELEFNRPLVKLLKHLQQKTPPLTELTSSPNIGFKIRSSQMVAHQIIVKILLAAFALTKGKCRCLANSKQSSANVRFRLMNLCLRSCSY